MSDSEKKTAGLCTNGCDFYGCEENHGFCSSCYNDYLWGNISMMSASISAVERKPEEELEEEANRGQTLPMPSDKVASLIQDLRSQMSHLPKLSMPSSSTKVPSRCTVCKKRTGLLGFTCQHCEDVFCGSHRHPEDHACSVNFKRIGWRTLVEQNPVIKSDKLGFRL
ncbi:hypothetical protein MLD38_021917 [Melastoma candidum]|uniref:Uncharacterized protein n=1 Tax=Melastoma candidum TaxID=119954 RepID=A0ACB9QHN6_9MYRT|nr:hypothetical protein MLD38_021917 [Melastoma candidum]